MDTWSDSKAARIPHLSNRIPIPMGHLANESNRAILTAAFVSATRRRRAAGRIYECLPCSEDPLNLANNVVKKEIKADRKRLDCSVQ